MEVSAFVALVDLGGQYDDKTKPNKDTYNASEVGIKLLKSCDMGDELLHGQVSWQKVESGRIRVRLALAISIKKL